MFRQIQWGEAKSNPFISSEPLKITLHVQSFENIPEDEQFALNVLKEFLHKKDLLSPILTTKEDGFPYITLGTYDEIEQDYSFTAYIDENTTIYSGVNYPRNDASLIESFMLKGENETQQLRIKIQEDILFARAHQQLEQQLFVTCSPHLLANRQFHNICSPKEAMKIIGLLLRKHGETIFYIKNRGTFTTNINRFYWVLAHSQLPHMSQYLKVCGYSKSFRADNTSEIGRSVVVKAAWAIQTRDAIAREFYANSHVGSAAYHFTYLTLLIAGVFDSMAIIAYRAYNLTKPDEKNVNFWGKDFLKALEANAKDLHKEVTRKKFQDMVRMVRDFRNTIHKESISLRISQNYPNPDQDLLDFPSEKDVVATVKLYGDLESWGIDPKNAEGVEPYTIADKLVKEMFVFIDKIAELTYVEGLLPSGVSLPIISNSNKKLADIWDEKYRKHIELLGW